MVRANSKTSPEDKNQGEGIGLTIPSCPRILLLPLPSEDLDFTFMED